MLREALRDRDPAIAALAAKILTARTGSPVAPQTTVLPVPAIPPAEYIRGLAHATARITMRGLGTITIDLLTDEAPVTVAAFATLAEAHQYDGLTFHRVEPNFVIQGGSPGADEYDGRSRDSCETNQVSQDTPAAASASRRAVATQAMPRSFSTWWTTSVWTAITP